MSAGLSPSVFSDRWSAEPRRQSEPAAAVHEGAAADAANEPVDVSRCRISVVVLTLNEESNLDICMAGVHDWAYQIFVVDAGSTDRTKLIAELYSAVVVEHPFETHAKQWQWALDNLPLQTEWVLALDADQRVTPELAGELAALRPKDVEGVEGFFINRRQVFRGRWIRHGDYYPKYLLKLFRRSRVRTDAGDLVDHRFYVTGKVKKLRYDVIESNRKEDDIAFWIEKHSRYAVLLAREELRWRAGSKDTPIMPSLGGNPDQQSLARRQLWRHMPLYVRPFLYFAYRYFMRCGFLDGKQGAIFHFLQAFWFRLLVDIQLDDMIARSQMRSSKDGVCGAEHV